MKRHSPNVTRRTFLEGGTAAAATGVIAIGESWPVAAMAVKKTIEDELTAVSSTSNAAVVQRLTAELLTDPAIPTLASFILQNFGSSLTPFQVDLLKAMLLEMSHNPRDTPYL